MREDNLFIISSTERIQHADKHYNAAAFVVLYYEEKVEFYKDYLIRIPKDIDVYIISSKEAILDIFDDRFKKLKKNNRGRDISGLLVAAKPYIFRYEYICFIHDKKEKTDAIWEYTREWEQMIWESLLASGSYIVNLLYTMDSRSLEYMGVMLPFYSGLNRFPTDGYEDNVEGVRVLSQKIGIEYEEDDPPITFATCFWAKTDMLKKLYSIDWKYEDFPDPAVNIDGDLNHSVERIFKYLLKDRGKDEAICISDRYMAYHYTQVHSGMQFMWEQLKKVGVHSISELMLFPKISKALRAFSERYRYIYIYGAGNRAASVFNFSALAGIRIDGFTVTTLSENQKEYLGLPVIEYGKEISSESGIIIGVGLKQQKEVISIIKNGGKQDYLLLEF